MGGFGWGAKSLCWKSLCAFSVPYFWGFARWEQTILGVFEVFLGTFEKTKEKKDRASWPALGTTEPPLWQAGRATSSRGWSRFNLSGTFKGGGPKWGVRFFSVTSKWRADDATSLDFGTINKVVWGKACVSFVWRASAHALATQMSHTPRSAPPR